ncbi:regulator of Vps4 activity in the MVB pathway-domain-containing protein [Gongronella butleri]|nr:regulator of Vps4 activity in the MVB pathway-domain-containing protein [Gongronella butleri]
MYNATRLKVQLKLAIKRLKMLQEKKQSLGQHQRREIAMLLDKGKVESARIRVEHIIRDDLLIEAMEIMELFCDILLARFGLLEQYKDCDPGIAEAVNTIIWASPRLGEAKELAPVRDQLAAKFGKEFTLAAMENENDVVSARVYSKLQVNAPDPFLVERYLEEIAKGYHVQWLSDRLEHDVAGSDDEDDDDEGGQRELAQLEAEAEEMEAPDLEPPLLATPKINDASTSTNEKDKKVDTPSPPSPAPSPEFVATSKALIKKLLQLPSARLDAKIVSVLLLDGMIDLLMEHITRMDEPMAREDYEGQPLARLIEWAAHARDRDDLEAMKRSYHAMEILCGTSANHFWIQDTKCHDILRLLFHVFFPTSHGNFYHFNKILQHFLRRHPCDTLDFIFAPQNDAVLFYDYMLPYMTEPPIMDTILSLLFVNDINDATRERREQAHQLLSTRLITWLLRAIDTSPDPAYALTAAELLLRIIDECAKINNGHHLVAVFLHPDKGGRTMMNAIVKLVVGQKPSSQRQCMIKILHSLVQCGTLVTRTAIASQPVHGPLHEVSLRCQEMLTPYIAALCSVIAHDHADVSSKQLPLTVSDMDLLDTIYALLGIAPTSLIDKIPTQFWRIVVNSFFEKKTSTIYHTMFFRLIYLAVSLQHDPLIVVLIRRQKLITRMIDLYEDKMEATDVRGFILLILNYLRLMTDAEKTGVLHRIVSSHPRFVEFLPTLRSETMAQLQFKYKWNLSSSPRPPIYLGPCPPIRPSQFASYTPTLQLTGGDHDVSGIDLGSDFAYCLGFDHAKGEGYETPRANLSRHYVSPVFSLFTMYDSDEEDIDCPLCMEELDIADRNFRPCTCGYQICRFCWHHIKENLNGRCPACRREYSEQMAEFQPVSADEIARIKREKKEKERQQKDMEAVNRRHLANMRVVQKNLVYVIGLHPKYATEDIIRSSDYFGQFGKIAKVVINKRNLPPNQPGATMQPSAAIYVTYHRKEDADKAIQTVDGHTIAGRILRASYGTTKYCTYYLRNMTCPNPSCLYLHEPGEEADTISKEELATGKHRMRDQITNDDDDEPPSQPLHSHHHSHQAHHHHHHHHQQPHHYASDQPHHHHQHHHQHHQHHQNHHHPSSPSISNHDFPPVGSSSAASTPLSSHRKKPASSSSAVPLAATMDDDERSALPATASWAKLGGSGSHPSTPVLKSALPERTLTPDHFGPPLAVAAAPKQPAQPPPLSPNTLKRKLDKKKRKELQRSSTSTNNSIKSKSSSSATSSHDSTPILATQFPVQPSPQVNPTTYAGMNDALISFVLGDAMQHVGWLTPDALTDEPRVGVTALYDDNDMPTQQPNNNNTQLLEDQFQQLSLQKSLLDTPINTLDFLLNTVPTPTYRGSFNPFAHQILRATGNLFESPMRKTSRFGFAQM